MHTCNTPLPVWSHPNDYGGFSPDGDLILLSRTRDSGALERSNWTQVGVALGAVAFDARDAKAPRPNVYHWRAGHWACGWVEYLMIHADAPHDIIEQACAIRADLNDYLIFDEEHYSDLEADEGEAYWRSLSVRGRVELCQECGDSIFAARRTYPPENCERRIREL